MTKKLTILKVVIMLLLLFIGLVLIGSLYNSSYPSGELEDLVDAMFYSPIAALGFLGSLLTIYYFRSSSYIFHLVPLGILLISFIILTPPLRHQASIVLVSIHNNLQHWKEGKSVSEVNQFSEDYNELKNVFSKILPNFRAGRVICNVVETIQPYYIVNPLRIVDIDGTVITVDQLNEKVVRGIKNNENKLSQEERFADDVYIKLELPSEGEFNQLYSLKIPEDCLFKNIGGYVLPMGNNTRPLGVIPAIIHVIPKPVESKTNSGTILPLALPRNTQ